MPPPIPQPQRASFTDYADWLNPMLVKELRQGLRKNWFTVVFIIVQLLLVGFLGFNLLTMKATGSQELGSMFDGVFWFVLGLLVMFIMPMRGLNAISEEKKTNTMELVQVTHLNSTRIVWGKWVSLVSQTLLLITAVLPYAVLRYFFGGVDIVDNLTTIAGMVLASLAISAVAIYFSTMPKFARGLPIILMMFGWNFGAVFLFGRFTGGPTFTMMSLPVGIFVVIVITLFALALSAQRIAPIAENHSAPLRLIPLTAGLIALLATWWTKNWSWGSSILIVLLWSTFHALTERTNTFPALYRPWAQRGAIGKLAGRVLYPGWATGLFYSLLVVGLIAGFYAVGAKSSSLWESQTNLITCAVLFGALITPMLVLVHLPFLNHWGAIYFLIQLVGLAWFAVTRAVLSFGNHDREIAILDAITPTSAAIWALSHSGDLKDQHWTLFCMITLPLSALFFAYLLLRARKEFRLIRSLEQRSIEA